MASRWPCLVALLVAAETVAAGAGAVFEAGVLEVTLRFTATESGRPVAGLLPGDIEVREDGVVQEVAGLSHGREGRAIALVLDSSESMVGSMDDAISAARAFVRSVDDGDEVAVVEFDSEVRVLAGFAATRQETMEALGSMTPGGGTLLYDGMARGVELLAARPGARAMVVLSDGEDGTLTGGSRFHLDAVREAARRADVEVHTVGLGLAVSRYALEDLARGTGGTATFVATSGALERIYRELPREISEGYSVTYRSSRPSHDGTFRKVEVRVLRPGVEVTCKPGYYAPGPEAPSVRSSPPPKG